MPRKSRAIGAVYVRGLLARRRRPRQVAERSASRSPADDHAPACGGRQLDVAVAPASVTDASGVAAGVEVRDVTRRGRRRRRCRACRRAERCIAQHQLRLVSRARRRRASARPRTRGSSAADTNVERRTVGVRAPTASRRRACARNTPRSAVLRKAVRCRIELRRSGRVLLAGATSDALPRRRPLSSAAQRHAARSRLRSRAGGRHALVAARPTPRRRRRPAADATAPPRRATKSVAGHGAAVGERTAANDTLTRTSRARHTRRHRLERQDRRRHEERQQRAHIRFPDARRVRAGRVTTVVAMSVVALHDAGEGRDAPR